MSRGRQHERYQQHYYLDTGYYVWMWIGETYYSVNVTAEPEIWSVDPSGPWYAGETYDVTIWGRGFLGQVARACGGADWDNLQVWDDSWISGMVRVSNWPNEGLWLCVGAAVMLVEVLEPEPPPTVSIQIEAGKVLGPNGFVLTGDITGVKAVGVPSGGTYQWAVGPKLGFDGGSTGSQASVSGQQESTARGDTWVSVTYNVNGRVASAAVRFTVRTPRTLRATTLGGPSATITVPGEGYRTWITYNVKDQFDDMIELEGIAARG